MLEEEPYLRLDARDLGDGFLDAVGGRNRHPFAAEHRRHQGIGVAHHGHGDPLVENGAEAENDGHRLAGPEGGEHRAEAADQDAAETTIDVISSVTGRAGERPISRSPASAVSAMTMPAFMS